MFSLTLYRDGETDNWRPPAAPRPTGSEPQMKSTLMFRNIANPRRTTLAHLDDADRARPAAEPEQPEHAVELPAQTANPRRTVLTEAP